MSNPAAYAGELLHNIIEEKNNSPEYNVSIYISTLWGVKKRESGVSDNSDKLSKTGDVMFGELHMDGNRLTGLSHKYPPADLNDAASWGNVLLVLDNYVHKAGSMMTGPLGVGRGVTIIDNSVKIMTRPIEDVDATNKEYVDSKKPIIAIWAASHGSIVNGKSEWYFGEKIKNDTQSGFMMPVRGKIIRGSLSIAYNSGAGIFDVNTDVVQVEVNGRGSYLQINTGAKIFDTLPINQGDIISFKSIVNIRQAASATVCVLIELDF
jgi:hypothetical protein